MRLILFAEWNIQKHGEKWLLFEASPVSEFPFICYGQLSQAGDLIIEVYLEHRIPDCCITLKVGIDPSILPILRILLKVSNCCISKCVNAIYVLNHKGAGECH